MTDAKTPEHHEQLPRLDWETFRALAGRRMRALLADFGELDIDRALQDVSERMVKFRRLHPFPERPEVLLIRVVRAVSAEAIERRQRERALQIGDVSTWLGEPLVYDLDEPVVEHTRAILLDTLIFMRLKKAGYMPLAVAIANGESPKDYAARRKLSLPRVRRQWSRCAGLIREGIRQKGARVARARRAQRRSPHD